MSVNSFFGTLSSNTILVLLGTSLLGLSCGAVGTFAVLRRRALVGDALAHAALPGICVSYLLFHERSFPMLFIGALVFGLLSVFTIALIRDTTRIKEDAAIAITLSSFFGLGIALSRIIQNQPSGNRAGLDDFIFGKAASMVQQDVIFIAGISVIVLLAIALLIKEFKVLCFDKEFAWSQGFPVYRLDLGLMMLVCLCTVVGLPAVGVVLVSALLIFPAVTARLWTDRLETMVFLAGLLGFFSALGGTILSSELPGPSGGLSRGLPTGPLIVITCAFFFLLSLLLSPKRGLLSVVLKKRGGTL
jgi:manganese/zinc/iron transport system permease protein